MKISKSIVVSLILIFLLAINTSSQVSQSENPTTQSASKFTQINDRISVEEAQICTITLYNQIQNVYSPCIYYDNRTLCLNTTGPNTDCSFGQDLLNMTCYMGQITVAKNRTECKSNNDFIISINKGNTIIKKQIDSSAWGPCIYSNENDCLIVTCQSKYDGANDGHFHGCSGGTTCQKFRICNGEIKVFYKNSREDFVETDPTFYLPKLEIREAGK